MMRVELATRLPDEWLGMSRVFAALGNEQRQKMLLLFEPGEKLHLLQIVDACGLSRTAVMHHLKLLTDAGILQRERQGKEVVYCLDVRHLQATLANVQDYIKTHYEGMLE